MSLHSVSNKVLAMKFWQYPGFRGAHSVLSKKISRRSYELGMQGSIALFMCSAIVGVTAMRRRYAYYAQMEQDALIKHHMRSDPRYANYINSAKAGYTARLAAGNAAAFPSKQK
mmetsp:Transcript_10517/g.14613  ORF Transcript_10517/g.14613 Transcript_10517/m.14613 type:complete len:114 (-) Transcript_10517:410-751(-)|eukprot:CAMPEP_0184487358 /NCGR_PEP_ID=MMETSP0113_2-20130426/9886_1 /TAXON_ID=91329 /ORGANISM="Norrisiella sphaerica, Strain BC52" /LENGTH=113 /DNA_ID=CAMNT_0026869639 /DNA_START=62 /DNA_END=403 /DNA_ORIENTATION=-